MVKQMNVFENAKNMDNRSLYGAHRTEIEGPIAVGGEYEW